MNRRICFYVVGLCLLLMGGHCDAQQRSRAKGKPVSARQKLMENNPFFHQQWWVGMKGGLTMAKASPLERYAVLQALGSHSLADFDKEYLDYQAGNPATFIGLMGTFSFWHNFSLSLQPAYSSLKFGYTSTYHWEREGTTLLSLEQTHRLALSYLEVPLLLRYDIYKAKIRPYVQGGAFYGRLFKADKSMELKSFDAASGALDPLSNHAPTIGARELFIRSNSGWLAGAGMNYDLGSLRLGLEINYKQGFNNITDRQNRFTDQRMIGVGDVMDDMGLRNWEAAFTLLFPLKFLDTGAFQPAKP